LVDVNPALIVTVTKYKYINHATLDDTNAIFGVVGHKDVK